MVGAECPSPDASRQNIGESGIALRDSFQHRLDRLADALPGSFRSRYRPPITSSDSDRARELPGQRIDLLFRLLGVLDVSRFLGFFQFFAQIGKPVPISRLGLIVEHLARVTETADVDSRLLQIVIATRQSLPRLP